MKKMELIHEIDIEGKEWHLVRVDDMSHQAFGIRKDMTDEEKAKVKSKATKCYNSIIANGVSTRTVLLSEEIPE